MYKCLFKNKKDKTLHSCLYCCSKLTSPATGVGPGTLHPPDGITELLFKPLRGKSESKGTTQMHYENKQQQHFSYFLLVFFFFHFKIMIRNRTLCVSFDHPKSCMGGVGSSFRPPPHICSLIYLWLCLNHHTTVVWVSICKGLRGIKSAIRWWNMLMNECPFSLFPINGSMGKKRQNNWQKTKYLKNKGIRFWSALKWSFIWQINDNVRKVCPGVWITQPSCLRPHFISSDVLIHWICCSGRPWRPVQSSRGGGGFAERATMLQSSVGLDNTFQRNVNECSINGIQN